MKRLLIIVYSAFLIILLTNYIYYKSLYKKQINYIIELLDRQVQIVGLAVDNTNYSFSSDLTQIAFFSEDLVKFFTNSNNQYRARERMKLFFSKYKDFVTGIKFYDNDRNEFTLKIDTESNTGEWLEQTFKLHVQEEILKRNELIKENKIYNYYLTVIDMKTNETVGNIVVTVDFKGYFDETFSEFNLKDYQWQWVLDDSGKIIYDNFDKKIKYLQIDKIASNVAEGSVDNIVHRAFVNDKSREIISSYYSTQLLQRDLGIVFSAPTDFFQKYIIRNSIFIVTGTLLLIQLIIYLFLRYLKSQRSEKERLKSSEAMLFKLIEEMPVGVIIHSKEGEIIKANKIAVEQFSYSSESAMKGRLFPEVTVADSNDYFSKTGDHPHDPNQFIVVKREIGEIILFRNSIPVIFMGEEASMEILIDVTMLESARKQEAKANIAKSEFLARMSYEIRTPLNGIIGMTDVLNKLELTPNVKEIVSLLHRSTEVLLEIINDILDFSKIETGKIILEEIPFDITEEIKHCIDVVKANINGDDSVLKYSIDGKVPESVIGDPFRLRQVVTNLINHSVSNTEKGEIHFNCSLKDNQNGMIVLGFELLDTGKSFDKAELKKIFGDFINIETKVFRANDESDFGTILAKQLIELMGGELTAVSPSGISGSDGTKVTFTLKYYSNERPVKDLVLEEVNSFDKIRTLVITGNQRRDEDLIGKFHKLGLTISVTTFHKSTIKQISANLNDPNERYSLIVILDDKVFNGFDAAKAIWENNLASDFVMMMISSNDIKGNYQKCITMGIDHYLVKPFDSSDLLDALESSFPHLKEKSEHDSVVKQVSNIKILVVEDNKMNQIVIGKILDHLGYSCDFADDGYAGYLQTKVRKYDLIFMDLIMPEMDGFQAARKILEHDDSVIIVAFTADNMEESKKKATLSGIRDFISKPVKIEDIKKLFATYFSN